MASSAAWTRASNQIGLPVVPVEKMRLSSHKEGGMVIL